MHKMMESLSHQCLTQIARLVFICRPRVTIFMFDSSVSADSFGPNPQVSRTTYDFLHLCWPCPRDSDSEHAFSIVVSQISVYWVGVWIQLDSWVHQSRLHQEAQLLLQRLQKEAILNFSAFWTWHCWCWQVLRSTMQWGAPKPLGSPYTSERQQWSGNLPRITIS